MTENERPVLAHETAATFRDDDTLPAVRANPDAYEGLAVEFVRNPSRGAHAAIMAGFAASKVAGGGGLSGR